MLDIIAKHEGVNSVAVFNKNGYPVHQAGRVAEDKNKLAEYISLVGSLSSKARSLVRDLDPQVRYFNRITIFFRVIYHFCELGRAGKNF